MLSGKDPNRGKGLVIDIIANEASKEETEMSNHLGYLGHHLEEKFKDVEGLDARELSLGSWKGSTVRWYNQLNQDKIRTWKDLAKAFTKHYKHITYIEPYRLTLQNMKMRPDESFRQYMHRWRDVATQERKEYAIEECVPDDLAANASGADKDKFKKHMDDMLDVDCLMLATMTPELQKQHMDMVAYEMIQNLKEIYEGQARQERYETSKALFQCKMSEGSPVEAHVIKMMGYIQMLEKLRSPLKDELATDAILQSFPDRFNPCVLNYNMNEINKTLSQLLVLLQNVESHMKKMDLSPFR
ncbi:hypothetical protein GQ457_11G024160 [Hibiscus cannabinus]